MAKSGVRNSPSAVWYERRDTETIVWRLRPVGGSDNGVVLVANARNLKERSLK